METEWVIGRINLYQLWREHPGWSAKQFAQELGYSESWVKKWRRRFQSTLEPTPTLFLSQSRAPKQRRHQVHPEVIKRILYLRTSLPELYHRVAGAKLIVYHLHQDLHLQAAGHWLPQSKRPIYRIRKAAGYLAKRIMLHEPLVRPAPLEEWEIDFGETTSIGGENGAEFLVSVDRGTSILLYHEARPRFYADTALLSIAQMLLVCGLPQRLRFDRDSRLFGSWTRDSYPSPLSRFLRCLGIEPIPCPPRRPDKKPFVERLIYTVKHEWLFHHRPSDLPTMQASLVEFQQFYNLQRPNQALSCGNQPPGIAFPNLPPLPALPEIVDPDRWLLSYHGRVFERRVNANGRVMIDRYPYYVGRAYAGQRVAFHVDARQALFRVQLNGKMIATFAIQGLHGTHLSFQDYLTLMLHEAQAIERYHQRLWEQTNWEEPF